MRKLTWSVGRGVVANAALAAALAVALAGCVVQPAYQPAYRPAPPPAPEQGGYEQAGATVQVQVEPPALPVYEQPPCPEEGYLWTPGYWAWAGSEYYWVPGTWVMPPRVGVYWTPAYWGWAGGVYVFHGGYWGPHVGFYGGINYGGGYIGTGFHGGRWDDRGRFAYNTAVTNVNTTIVRNTYNVTVVNNVNITNVTNNRVSYNGGPRGTAVAPTSTELVAAREPHVAPTPMQVQHVQAARQNPALLSSVNQGHPSIAATPRPGAFTAPGVVAARPGPGGAMPAQGTGHPAQPGAPANSYHPGTAPGENSGYHAPQPPPAGNPGYHAPQPAPAQAPGSAGYHAPPPVPGQPPANAGYHPPPVQNNAAAHPPAPAPKPAAPPPKPKEHEHDGKGGR